MCELYRGEYIICISESGKFFISQGMWAKDSDDFWNGLLGECEGGFLHWMDYKARKNLNFLQIKITGSCFEETDFSSSKLIVSKIYK